jgi:tripartite-type tricarboxylate transporter receptor subunit TctC
MEDAMDMRQTLLGIFATGVMALTGSASSLHAETWPQRTVRIIMPGSAGQGLDVPARLFAERLAERWKQPVIIENRPGADGLIGTAAFANLRDDHALLFWNAAVFTLYPLLQEKLPYDPRRDIVPISAATDGFISVTVSNQLRTSSLRALLDVARSQPGKLNYNAAAGELPYLFSGFLKGAGIDMVLVPYRDLNLAIQDIAEGRLDVYMSSLTSVLPLAQAGKIRLLAVTNKQRAPMAPEVPTAIEAGFPELAVEGLAGFFGSREMPADRQDRVAADIRAVAADPILGDRLAAIGVVALGSTPAEFAAAIELRRSRMVAMVKLVGSKPGPPVETSPRR